MSEVSAEEGSHLVEFVQSVWPSNLGPRPDDLSDLTDVKRPYLLQYAYLRYWRAADRSPLSPELHTLICCLLRAVKRKPEEILREATHNPLQEDDAEVVDFVRRYYAADDSPLRDFAPHVDSAYLRRHREALAAVYQEHLSLVRGHQDLMPAHLHARIRRILGYDAASEGLPSTGRPFSRR
ncbi:hypothetical protein [Streptosporangium canum]|uniref:hypothetical protein n=1 Tax=Streptosporangium canum TaxID=324952 RepID=UPI0037BC9AC6